MAVSQELAGLWPAPGFYSGEVDPWKDKSLLADTPSPDVLTYGKVTINNDFIIDIEIVTDQLNKTYNVKMEHGPAGPTGSLLRKLVSLGTITTDRHGRGEAQFPLPSPPPRIVGPSFVIYSSSSAADFETSYGPPPSNPPPPPSNGRVILIKQTVPDGSPAGFNFSMSYGGYFGYPNGGTLLDNQQFDSGFTVPPGVHTINENPPPGWQLPAISIDDPSGGSFSAGTLTTINLAPGETVTVTYTNTQLPPPPPQFGRIILNKETAPDGDPTEFSFNMTYGSYCGYASGLQMSDNDQLDSGFTVPPGVYFISEILPVGWLPPAIIINDASGGSFSTIEQVTVNLMAGETVTVTYFNDRVRPPLPPSALVDQENRENIGTSWGGMPEFLYQSFTPTASNLTAVELLLRPGGLFPIGGTSSVVMIREGSPAGQIIGLATTFVLPPEVPGDQLWVCFVFDSSVTLTPGEEYVIAWYMPGAATLTWMGNEGNPYDRGSAFNSLGHPIPDVDFNFVSYYASVP